MPELTHPELSAIDVEGHTRGAFLTRATLAASAVVGAAALGPFVEAALAEAKGDIDILQFALTLEHLEAAFYAQALKTAPLSEEVRTLARELGAHEATHVKALTATIRKLGGAPHPAPGLRFGGAFASEQAFLRTASMLEETGVSAYNGAAPRIRSKEILAAAGSIVQVEARHAALIRLQRGKPPAPGSFDRALGQGAVKRRVAPFLA